ncbi:DUF998 domain-containing protein [Nonomuraea zeae]|uniref:DUF998 domain-containing protein n=1 Tax=Nonomuraea zeae TaxID=1642303 RepID=A0A5S4GN80_9ACTN|nr:DUF998 domain-containing protein [Nonomuraea zeae]TMR34242.1 DUF998 domain-containing protein [Nonomuraea zeae]
MSKKFSLTGFAIAILSFVMSDVVNRGYDPMDETISRYVNLPYGWLVTIGLLGFAVGTAALASSAADRGWGGGLLWVWAGCALVTAIFPADPPGNWANPSLSESVHGVAAWVGLLALAIAIVGLTRRWRREPAWASKARGLTVLAWASSAAFVLFAVAMADAMAFTHTAPLGLAERVLLGLNVLWLALAATGPSKTRFMTAGSKGNVTTGSKGNVTTGSEGHVTAGDRA